MTRRGRSILAASAMAWLAAGIGGAAAAAGEDPDWPCIQRKVPELSLGQVWTGPELPPEGRNWTNDKEIAALVAELSARRLPLAEAQERIRAFAEGLPDARSDVRLLMLVQALFDRMNAERSEVMSGIQRYARKQRDLADALRLEGSQLDAFRARADADPDEIERRTERLLWNTRIFDERVQSLTYVCEVPTLIEQRLYALAKTIAEVMGRE